MSFTTEKKLVRKANHFCKSHLVVYLAPLILSNLMLQFWNHKWIWVSTLFLTSQGCLSRVFWSTGEIANQWCFQYRECIIHLFILLNMHPYRTNFLRRKIKRWFELLYTIIHERVDRMTGVLHRPSHILVHFDFKTTLLIKRCPIFSVKIKTHWNQSHTLHLKYTTVYILLMG